MNGDEILKPGRYTVTATLRHTVVVEAGEEMTAIEAVDEAVEHAGHDIIDWELTGRIGGRDESR